MSLLIIDPSITKLGAALFTKGRPVDCNIFKETSIPGVSDERTRMYRMVQSIDSWLQDIGNPYISSVVTEDPGYRGQDKNKKSIMTLCEFVGFICGHYMAHGKMVHTITPIKWKSNYPKKVTEIVIQHEYPYLQKRINSLSKSENLLSNVYDALGIGMYFCSDYETRKYVT